MYNIKIVLKDGTKIQDYAKYLRNARGFYIHIAYKCQFAKEIAYFYISNEDDEIIYNRFNEYNLRFGYSDFDSL